MTKIAARWFRYIMSGNDDDNRDGADSRLVPFDEMKNAVDQCGAQQPMTI